MLLQFHDNTVEPLSSGLRLSGYLPQPGSLFSLFYADLAENVGSTVGVAYYSLYTDLYCILRYG